MRTRGVFVTFNYYISSKFFVTHVKQWLNSLNPQSCVTLTFSWTCNLMWRHLLIILDTPYRAHLLTPRLLHGPLCALTPTLPFHPILSYYQWALKRRALAQRRKTWRIWQLPPHWWERQPTIKTASWVLCSAPDSPAHTRLLAVGLQGWRKRGSGGMRDGQSAAWS